MNQNPAIQGTALALAPKYDKPGKRDATRAFIPEARKFVDAAAEDGLTSKLFLIDNKANQKTRREQVFAAIQTSWPLEHLAVFAHGWRTGIQFGFRMKHLSELAKEIGLDVDGSEVIVSLYCCSTAQGKDVGGDGGFADGLRDALCEKGLVDCVVDAHTTKGHTTRNPHVRRFEGRGSAVGGTGGYFLVPPRSTHWRAWRQELRGELRFQYSRMCAVDIIESLV